MRAPLSTLCLCLLLAAVAIDLRAQGTDSDGAILRTAEALRAQDIPALLEKAKAGDQRSQLLLGIAYHRGFGVQKDDAEAVKWYHLAAEQGVRLAQYALGFMYREGKGVPQDDSQAVNWYRKAAEQGDADAQLLIGIAYLRGTGVARDFTEGERWLRMAALQGNATAQDQLGGVYLSGVGVPKNATEAVKWFRMAAEQRYLHAEAILCAMYGLGRWQVSKNKSEAETWCRKQARDGSCHLRVRSDNDVRFSFEGEGFEPGEELTITSRSEDEMLPMDAKASPKGTYRGSMYPQVTGKKEGTASFTIKGQHCEVSVVYNWRSP